MKGDSKVRGEVGETDREEADEMEGEAEAWREERAPGAPAEGGEEAAATAAAAAVEGEFKDRLKGGRVGEGMNPPETVLRRQEEEGACVGSTLVLQLFTLVGLREVLSRTAGRDVDSQGADMVDIDADWEQCWKLLPQVLA